VKHRLTLRVQVLGGSPGLIKWGDWGWAARVELAYTHPRTGALMTIEELVRVTDPDGWTLRLGEADVSCWGCFRADGYGIRYSSRISKPYR
jgi:hypothetical protein